MWSYSAWVSCVNSLIHLNETYQNWVIIGWGILGIAWAFKEPGALGRSLAWHQNLTSFISGIIRLSCWVCFEGTPAVSFTTGPLSELPAGTHLGLRSQPVLVGCFLCLLLIFLCFGFDDILFLRKSLEEFFTSLLTATVAISTRKNLRVSRLIVLL